ncbi:hypothetical protein [Faecalispora jeddahensis]|uniref:hypothetical protein n=1 Tax=Faecalispora jeddahensis TaxID=1414721 RepID=UPI0027B9AA64|nr:hypothetical protein [Faecalispora jeddahensis]
MNENVVLSEDILKIINSAVSQAVSQAVQQTKAVLCEAPAASVPAETRNYFYIMEKLLYNYPALKKLISDKESYTKVDLQGRSNSVVRFNPNSSWKSQEDIQEEMERDKETRYNQTLSDFRRVEEVIDLFKHRKEFIVVRMYYFGEDAAGNARPAGAEQFTWEDIAFELSDIGLIRDAKSARRWRNKIVNDMAVCLFGIEAAIQGGTLRDK